MGAGASPQRNVWPTRRMQRSPTRQRASRRCARSAWSLLFAFGMSLVGGASLVLAPEAVAHNAVVCTTPEDGATVVAPDVVDAIFDEDLSGQAPRVVVIDSAGRQRQIGAPVVAGHRITQSVGTLPSGTYVMSVSVTSADGHPVTSSASFTVADAPAPPAGPTATPSHPFTHDSSAPPVQGDLFGEGDDLAAIGSEGSSLDDWLLVGFGMAFAVGVMAALSMAAFERRGARGASGSARNAGKEDPAHRYRRLRGRWWTPFKRG